MSRFLSLKLLATVGSKSRAVTKFRAAAATTGAASNLVRHFSLGQALGINLVEPEVVNYKTDNLPKMKDWSTDDPPSIAVILSGCGQLDGTDVHEAIYTMMHLHKVKRHASLFASIDRIQEVINHFPESNNLQDLAPRYMLNESKRLTCETHEVNDLENLRVEDHEGLIIPGGIGIFRNLTDYFTREPARAHLFEMDNKLNQILLDFYRHRKPIGFIRNASVLAARVFQGVAITLGNESYNAEVRKGTNRNVKAAKRLKAKLIRARTHKVVHDANYNIYSTPSLLTSIDPPKRYERVSDGISQLINKMVKLTDDEPFANDE